MLEHAQVVTQACSSLLLAKLLETHETCRFDNLMFPPFVLDVSYDTKSFQWVTAGNCTALRPLYYRAMLL